MTALLDVLSRDGLGPLTPAQLMTLHHGLVTAIVAGSRPGSRPTLPGDIGVVADAYGGFERLGIFVAGCADGRFMILDSTGALQGWQNATFRRLSAPNWWTERLLDELGWSDG